MLQEAALVVAADTLNQHISSWARRSCILRYLLVTSCQWAQQITPGDSSLIISFSIARLPTAVLEVEEGPSNRESLSVITCTIMFGRK